jgi:MinD-like ATPase involved in chromosome partitioning or flagellar assembly
LRNEARLEDAMYSHALGLKVIPGSLNLKDIVDINVVDLKNKLKETFSGFDIVLIDSAPGLGKEALIALQASDEILYVANPQIPSVIDIAKCKDVVNKLDNKPSTIGIIVNRVRNRGYEIKNDEITQFTGLPVIGIIPEDEKILESTNKKTLVTMSKNNSSSSKAFFKIAAKISGAKYEYSFFDKIKKIFKKEKEF